jgi:hypothetical protein
VVEVLPEGVEGGRGELGVRRLRERFPLLRHCRPAPSSLSLARARCECAGVTVCGRRRRRMIGFCRLEWDKDCELCDDDL